MLKAKTTDLGTNVGLYRCCYSQGASKGSSRGRVILGTTAALLSFRVS